MMRFALAAALALFSCCLNAAGGNPGPAPAPKATVTFTQGTHSQTLPAIASTICGQINNGVIRYKVGACPITGSYVQFPVSGGDVTPHWSLQDACPPKPAPLTRPAKCPEGTTGPGWTQTATYTSSPAPTCWVLGPYLPIDPPAGTCTQTEPPPFQWLPPRDVSNEPMQTRPPRGSGFVGPYGLPSTRITDVAVDMPGLTFVRNEYSRRQPCNVGCTNLLFARNDGAWVIYTPAGVYVKKLNGIGGDADPAWSATDPNVLYYGDRNGGTKLYKLDVAANTSSVQFDFGSIVRAWWPDASRCWTREEGAPSADGRLWGFSCETDGFVARGYVVLDIFARTAVWHRDNTQRPDHVSMTPSGRWFVRGNGDSLGTQAYNTAGATVQLSHTAEHSDLGTCNGHDFYISADYETNLGEVFVTDIDAGAQSRSVLFNIYHNVWMGNGDGTCDHNCAYHVSARALDKPCWVLFVPFGDPPANMVAVNVATHQVVGITANYVVRGNYQDEPHATPSRDFRMIFYNEDFGHGTVDSSAIDVMRVDVPALPAN